MNNLSVWKQLTQFPYMELYVKLLGGAMQLDVFSDLTEKISPPKLAEKHGWNAANTEYLPAALTAIGFVEKDGKSYQNVPEASRFLVKDTPEYLGGFRQQELLAILRALPEYEKLQRILDMGCATGLLGLSVIAGVPGRTGVLFEQAAKSYSVVLDNHFLYQIKFFQFLQASTI